MKKLTIVSGVAAIAVFVGVIYVARDRGGDAREPGDAVADPAIAAAAPRTSVSASSAPATNIESAPPAAEDPRLRALAVSPDNGRIEFIRDPDGRVIREIDRDPASPSVGRPLREYTYAGDHVIAHVAYHYLGDQVQIIRTGVSYHPDGRVKDFRETTSYEPDRGNR